MKKDRKIISELKRMKVLGGLLKENSYSDDNETEEVDYQEIGQERNTEILKTFLDIFGEQVADSADWGGIKAWSLGDSNYYGYFVIDDSEFTSELSYSIIHREYSEGDDENTEQTLYTAFVVPESLSDSEFEVGSKLWNGSTIVTIEALIEKAIEIKDDKPTETPINESEEFGLPENKKTINAKLSSKNAIKNALYAILKSEKVEGIYHDDSWQGVNKFVNALTEVGAEVNLVQSGYKGHGEVKDYESLPTKKVYMYDISVRDKKGNVITIPFMLNCIFVGRTGTMSDDKYELTYYATM